MSNPELFAMRQQACMKAFAHEEGDYVPLIANPITAGIAYSGTTFNAVKHDPQAYANALNSVYDEMWCDGIGTDGVAGTFDLESHFDPVQYRIGPDEVSLIHLQTTYMEASDYPDLIKDLDGMVLNKLLPRKYPRFFTDREWAKEGMKRIVETNGWLYGVLTPAAFKDCVENRNMLPILNLQCLYQNPLDYIFDYLRGFKGTLMDLRRQKAALHDAIDVIWEKKCEGLTKNPIDAFPFPVQFCHIPTYLSPKQFEEFYWPYEKKFIEWCASQGSKLCFVMEGTWMPFMHLLNDAPKDSCVVFVDEDDIFETKKCIGDNQIIMGGIHLTPVRMGLLDDELNNVKRVIDECAAGGGLLLTTDKAWVTPGDVNKTLVDLYNSVHEYAISK